MGRCSSCPSAISGPSKTCTSGPSNNVQTAEGRRPRDLIVADFMETPPSEELSPLDTQIEQRNGCNLCPAGFEKPESQLRRLLENEYANSNTNAERTKHCRKDIVRLHANEHANSSKAAERTQQCRKDIAQRQTSSSCQTNLSAQLHRLRK